MKKAFLVLVALLLVFSLSFAFAESTSSTSSPTAGGNNQGETPAEEEELTEDDTVLDEDESLPDLAEVVDEETIKSLTVLMYENSEKIQKAVEILLVQREEGLADIELLLSEMQDTIESLLGIQYEKDDLIANAYCQVLVYNLDSVRTAASAKEAENAKFKLDFNFDTKFEKGKQEAYVVVRLFGLNDEGEEEVQDEFLLGSQILSNGNLRITFTLDKLQRIDDCNKAEGGHADVIILSTKPVAE